MKTRFSEIEKEQTNAYLPIGLMAKIRKRADARGWSIARTLTQAIVAGIGDDPAEYGIETQESVR